jgi:hypothetical protein
MKNPRPIMERLELFFADPDRGVLDLVDEILGAARQQDLRLGWQAGCFSVVFLEGSTWRRFEVLLQKSVVRAALARIAVLCNERNPGSVSPYGGQGEVAIEADPSKVIRATFVNTHQTQSLELACVSTGVKSCISPSHVKSAD